MMNVDGLDRELLALGKELERIDGFSNPEMVLALSASATRARVRHSPERPVGRGKREAMKRGEPKTLLLEVCGTCLRPPLICRCAASRTHRPREQLDCVLRLLEQGEITRAKAREAIGELGEGLTPSLPWDRIDWGAE